MSESEMVLSLLHDAAVATELRAALEAASAHDPTPGELAGLSKKLAALLPPGTLPPAPAPPAAPAAPDAPPFAGGGLSGAAKLAGALAVLGAIGGAAWLAGSPPPVVTPAASAAPIVAASAVVAASGAPVPLVEPVASASAPTGPVESPPREDAGPASPSVPATASGRPPSSFVASGTGTGAAAPLEPEALMIRRAHDALLRGAPDRALVLVAEHARAYPTGALAQEREVIAIEALVAEGRRADAQTRAAAFRAAHPGSVHLGRLERLVGAP